MSAVVSVLNFNHFLKVVVSRFKIGPQVESYGVPLKTYFKFSLTFFLCISLFGLAACGKREINLAVAGSKTLNLNDGGEPLPVLVRIYQLKGKEKIEGTDFISLWKGEQAILDGDLLDRQEITLLPDTKVVIKIDPKKEAEYLALMALFRKPQGNGWREIIPLKDKKVRSVEISVGEQTVKASKIE
jgi:type VI secretion system protein VasD